MSFAGDLWISHGAFAHQTDELMRPRLSCHPQEDFPEWVIGNPAVLDLITAGPVVGVFFWVVLLAKNLGDGEKSH